MAADDLPDEWFCEMNADVAHASCDAPEQSWGGDAAAASSGSAEQRLTHAVSAAALPSAPASDAPASGGDAAATVARDVFVEARGQPVAPLTLAAERGDAEASAAAEVAKVAATMG